MKHALMVAFLVALTATAPALSKGRPVVAGAPSASAPATALDRTAGEGGLIEHRSYINRDGATVHSPAHTLTGTAPGGASAQCRDGSYSFSRHRSGTCSHHGGVGAWL